MEVGEEALNRAFDEILKNLRTQYLIGYYPPEHTDPKTRFRSVEVKVDLEDTKVLARAGYYVPKERQRLPPRQFDRDISVTPRDKPGWRSVETTESADPQP